MNIPEPLREQAIDDFLDGQPRADQWRSMRESLEDRLRDSRAARDAETAAGRPTAPLDRKIRELRAQIEALAQEEAVTQFVEDSVRSSLAQAGHRAMTADDEEDSGF